MSSLRQNQEPQAPLPAPPAQLGTSSSSRGSSPLRSTLIRIPELADRFQKSGFVLSDPVTLPAPGRAHHHRTEVDIIAIPAIGAHPIDSWQGTQQKEPRREDDIPNVAPSRILQSASLAAKSTPATHKDIPWCLHDVRKAMAREARVLLYNHGTPHEGHELQDYADEFLHHLLERRRLEQEDARPLIFICHSTGGLVAKAALVRIKEDPAHEDLLARCFGVVFLATPHLGSSYLASVAFSNTVGQALNSIWYLPESTQAQLAINHPVLINLSVRFRSAAADLKIWTFWEAEDTNLTNSPGNAEEELFFHAPIVSKISAILKLRSEDSYQLVTDHAGCAAFYGDSALSKAAFIRQLKVLVERAIKLCSEGHAKLLLKDKVEVEVHGFFEEQSASLDPSLKPIRMYSSTKTLNEFLKIGPSKCIEDRLGENAPSPERRKFTHTSSRARTLSSVRISRTSSPGSDAEASKKRQPTHRSKFLGVGDSSDDDIRSSSEESRTPNERPGLGPTHHDELAEEKPDYFGHPMTLVVPPTPAIPTLDVPISPKKGTGSTRIRGTARPPINRSHSERRSPQVPEVFITASRPDSRGSMESHGRPDLPRISTRQASPRRGSIGGSHTAPQPGRKSHRDKKITWIHLPWNNPSWVSDVIHAINRDGSVTRDAHSKLLQNRFWNNRHVWAKHTEHHGCYVEPGCILVEPHTDSSPTSSPNESIRSRSGSDLSEQFPRNSEVQMSLFLPYLHWDTYKKIIQRRFIIKERLERGRARPVPRFIGKLDGPELQISWMYLAYSPPFNTRRTLDQFGYPHLNDTRARDDDQMLYKMTKESDKDFLGSDEENELSGEETDEEDPGVQRERKFKEIETLKDGKVLMVDQLWLFITDKKTLSTFFVKREGSTDEEKIYQQMDLRNSIYSELNADLSTRCDNALDLAGVICLHSINLMFRRDTIHELQVFRIFEESVSVLVEKMTKSFKYFRAKGFRAISENDEDEKESSIIRRHKKEGEQFQAQIRDNTSALLELRDIADELKTLNKLFDQQHMALDKMRNWYRKLGYRATVGYDALEHALRKLAEYKKRVDDMLQRAEEAKNDFEKLLELIQRQANVDEARLTRWQADLTNNQTRALNIFTVFTVIFLPLSFFTSVFGMNAVEFSDGSFMSLRRIALWSLPISAGLVIGTFIIAFSTSVRSILIYILKFPIQPIEKYSPAQEAWDARRRAEKARRKEKLRRLQELHPEMANPAKATSTRFAGDVGGLKHRLTRYHKTRHVKDYIEMDFWDEHRVQSVPLYEIPNSNKKRSALMGAVAAAEWAAGVAKFGTHYSDASDGSRKGNEAGDWRKWNWRTLSGVFGQRGKEKVNGTAA